MHSKHRVTLRISFCYEVWTASSHMRNTFDTGVIYVVRHVVHVVYVGLWY